MRLTVCLEGDAEGRVLASVDMEEIVKMTITDNIDKSNFNPQMLKTCTDTSYECGYQQGRADAIDECIKAITNFCGGLPNNNLISALEQLKEQNK